VHPFIIIFSLLILSSFIHAAEPAGENDILATRGNGQVTQAMFTARADRIPADVRLEALRNGSRLQDVINTMLLRSQLATDARAAGFQNEEIVIARMQLAADTELADAWVQHYIQTQPEGDYEQLAREYYQLNQESMLTSPTVDVSHILISTKNRTQEEALELAVSLTQQLEEFPQKFDELVSEYSDDPSAASNAGKFFAVEKGDMVAEFEEAAFSLQQDEISVPVKTAYGYHIIRLDAHTAAEKISFEQVSERLIERERKQHRDRIQRDYLSSLTSLDVDMSEVQLLELVNRLFGDDYADPYTSGNDLQ